MIQRTSLVFLSYISSSLPFLFFFFSRELYFMSSSLYIWCIVIFSKSIGLDVALSLHNHFGKLEMEIRLLSKNSWTPPPLKAWFSGKINIAFTFEQSDQHFGCASLLIWWKSRVFVRCIVIDQKDPQRCSLFSYCQVKAQADGFISTYYKGLMMVLHLKH